MPPRQIWIFKFGCWATLLTAVVHLAGQLAGPQAPANDTERTLESLATTYRFVLPGGAERSLMDLMNGFSLIFALSLATMGSLGLIVQRRAAHDLELMLRVARTLAVTSLVMLIVSLTNFFIVPSLFLGLMTRLLRRGQRQEVTRWSARRFDGLEIGLARGQGWNGVDGDKILAPGQPQSRELGCGEPVPQG